MFSVTSYYPFNIGGLRPADTNLGLRRGRNDSLEYDQWIGETRSQMSGHVPLIIMKYISKILFKKEYLELFTNNSVPRKIREMYLIV